ncbi:hypothetical protein PHISCL_08737 [Aspergillus sclerotialis]|uniref:DUF7730 domain-containing protein n=1 Tax=Aspergillus sclerotialis TaxID=2070753 RepID=A0A3A2Z751_9EURO|nr:hypothetical protein PHISCL_08737 [Aspergillus sclerotialis]
MDPENTVSEQPELMAPKSLFGPYKQTRQNVIQAHGYAEVASPSKDKPDAQMQAADKEPLTVKQPDSTQTQTAAFFRLPAEIRWQIYEDLFTNRRVEIIRTKNRDPSRGKLGRYRLSCRQRRPRDPKNQTAPTVGPFTMTPIPIGLIFSCKRIYNETVLQLYWTTQFIFNTTNSMTRFLRTTSKDAQANIRHVELNQIMYNEPRFTEFRYYKLRSDLAWSMACEEMALNFTSLKVLHVDLAILDWPIRLVVGESWSEPLLYFGRGHGLEFANVKLSMTMFNEEKLKAAALAVEKEIMNPVAYQTREDERLARELAGPVRTKILRLII